MWFFDRWSSSRVSRDPRRAARVKRTAGVPSRSITVTNKSNSLTFTVDSSLVCTSPLAVTVVGFLDILTVSNPAKLRSFLLTICILAPESATDSLSSGSFIDAAGSTLSSQDFLHRVFPGPVCLFENPIAPSLARHNPTGVQFSQ